ncbi:MAG: methyl-accepting chemotaxis protein [Lysinibacillus sp.]|nr:methyl-accepting chemotaxis protein [Lysinibacillus sp.]
MKLKLGTKINLMFLTILLIFAVSVGISVNDNVRDGIKEFAVEKAKSDLNIAYRYIDETIIGEWHIKDGKLYKGSTLMNDNFEIVDKIGSDTGGTITIFQGDTRIATNVILENGDRAVGTKVSEVVAEAVLKNKDFYFGEANVAGHIYQTAYKPLLNEEGDVVGIFYVGAPQNIIDNVVTKILKNFLVILFVIILISFAVITIFSNRIKKRLLNITSVLKDAGQGDFTKTLVDNTNDELSDVSTSFNQMASSMKELINEVTNSSSLVETASNELLWNAKETSASTQNVTDSVQMIVENMAKQQEMVEDSANAINEITMGINQVSENALNVADASLTSMNTALSGQQSVENIINQMAEIYKSNVETTEVIKELESQSIEIGKIIEAITAISNQTNLLVLNAAIEAARAGEHGKGFAVVAEEVRKLSEETNNSASLISTIVEAIQKDIVKAAEMMDHTHGEIESGIKLVKDTGTTFQQIVSSFEVANDGIQELSAISEEMAASMEKINSSIKSVAKLAKTTSEDADAIFNITEEQITLTEQVADAASMLTGKAETLRKVIERFKI